MLDYVIKVRFFFWTRVCPTVNSSHTNVFFSCTDRDVCIYWPTECHSRTHLEDVAKINTP
jgi:hypothetical protein